MKPWPTTCVFPLWLLSFNLKCNFSILYLVFRLYFLCPQFVFLSWPIYFQKPFGKSETLVFNLIYYEDSLAHNLCVYYVFYMFSSNLNCSSIYFHQIMIFRPQLVLFYGVIHVVLKHKIEDSPAPPLPLPQ